MRSSYPSCKNPLIILLLVFASISPTVVVGQEVRLVPKPASMEVNSEANLSLPDGISVSTKNVPNDWHDHLNCISAYVFRATGGEHRWNFVTTETALLTIVQDLEIPTQGYRLVIDQNGIRLSAASLKGLSHGTATLVQLMGACTDATLPHLNIVDQPAVSYRSFMVDMGRNPHSLELLKETVDLLWYYKLDSLHLHLTDDQRIAFPSSAFPKLWDGLITLDQFKSLDAYAAVRGVSIIPELEVPGHSGLLLRHYPEVFGKDGTELATSEKAFDGIKTLLNEMMAAFPTATHIHVGGDEAFGVPETAQRDLLNRLHQFLSLKDKQMVVWEGPSRGEGKNKVHPDVIHINWRTINFPVNEMLDAGHRVVNAAWDPLYIVDHYPRTNFTMASPQHIYENLDLQRFKHVNPGIPTFSRPIEVLPSDQLIGFCMPWWEGRESNFLEQVTPRLIPLGEVAWNPPTHSNYVDFKERVRQTETIRSNICYPVRIALNDLVVPDDGVFHDKVTTQLTVAKWAEVPETTQIRYTLDGNPPKSSSTPYRTAFEIESSTTLRAALFRGDEQIGFGSRRNLVRVDPVENLALGKLVTSSITSGSPFSVQRLTDGGTGNLQFYLAYPATPEPVSVVVDLEQPQAVSRIVVHAYSINNSFEKYSVEVSVDGQSYELVAERFEKPDNPELPAEHQFSSRPVRFVRVKSQGNKGYVFDSFSKLTEIQVFAD